MTKRLSGIQKDILSLFRLTLREAAKKDRLVNAENEKTSFASMMNNPQENPTISYARKEFRRRANEVKRSDFKKIEYMIRKGHKQLKILKMPGTKVVTGAS